MDVLEQVADKIDVEVIQKNGVINPYALAEYISGRKIDWKKIDNVPQVLESILQTPYEELFDPKFEGPLFFGLKLNKKGVLERFHSFPFSAEITVNTNDLEFPLEDLQQIKTLGDLGSHFNIENIAELQVLSVDSNNTQSIRVTVRIPEVERFQRLAQVFNKFIVNSIAFDPEKTLEVNENWTPENASWQDQGRFFNETAEFFDPIQGAVANCYFVAALSAVAWASPFRIAHLTRALGTGQNQFTNLVTFFKPDSNGAVDRQVEVTDTVPVSNTTGNFIYCRSSEVGEIWPAVFEKAFAKLVTGSTTDQPDITATAWGDCVFATAQLTGGKRHYYGNKNFSADDIWNLVRSNSLSKRTFNPMTCWTYGTAPEGLSYSDANVVASHCYTILGWDFRAGKKYLILRNPWGFKEASIGTHNGTVYLHDVSWWRPIQLANPDGIFAIEASVFKQYFAGFGVVK